ncbi:2443_t:CDS:10 [Funneliformis mosseae]|uniref:Phospholipid-transporting ATPase n=1 Tax=Funneliformis mosseae TaxID=27381 RepID=A0A9N9AKR1_FUNMO|nr:2443_t:CDS:10 [Funneliformis mosseae]
MASTNTKSVPMETSDVTTTTSTVNVPETTSVVSESEPIITETVTITDTIMSSEDLENTIPTSTTPVITEHMMYTPIVTTETKVSTPNVTEIVESKLESVTKSEPTRKTDEAINDNDNVISSATTNEFVETNLVKDSSEEPGGKVEQNESNENENENMRSISNSSNYTTDANIPNEDFGRKPSSTRLKRSKTKIKNRISTGKVRRIYSNIDLPKEDLDRKGRPKARYVTNKIVTSKYTTWTFLPKNLFEQFRRAANLYFLFMAILGMIPIISVNNPILTLLPLSTVVFFTGLKDAIEDRNRHHIDKQFNSAICYHLQNFVNVNYPRKQKVPFWKRMILRIKSLFNSSSTSPTDDAPPQGIIEDLSSVNNDDSPPSEPSNEKHGSPIFRKVMWRNVRVGDFLFLRNNDAVPADSIILSTSEPEGTCFVETKDLDGETNLKPRRCVPDTSQICSPEDCVKANFYVDSEAPNSNLYSYSATLVMTEPDEDHTSTSAERPSSPRSSIALSERKWKQRKTIPVDINNLLLRAHVIRNTEWVIAITVFTGVETKIMLNSSETPSKRSRIEKEMNREVILNFFVLIILGLICAIGSALSTEALKNRAGDVAVNNLDSNRDGVFVAAFITFMASLIIFQNIIPISLYISIEFVKLWQAYFIYNDLQMWDDDSQTAAVPKSASWNLSDDLGQIEYIFSDKTGTLTRNIMEFRQCSIDDKVYGRNGWGGKTDAEKGKELIQGEQNVEKQDLDQKEIFNQYLNELKKTFEPKYSSTDPNFLTFVDPEIYKDLRGENDETSDDVGEESNSGGKLEHKRKRSNLLREFFTLLAVCHTVVVDEIPSVADSESQGSGSSNKRKTSNNEATPEDTSDPNLDENIEDQNHSNLDPTKKKLKSSLKQILPSFKKLESALSPLPNGTTKSIPIDRTVVKNIVYKAESPDEAALVAAAKNVGFSFLSRTANTLTVDILGKEHIFEILNTLEFNSTRKRMSVIVRRPDELGGGIVLFCKGADNVIMERLAKGQEEFVEVTNQDIEDFSNDDLNEAQYNSWSRKYNEAASSLTDRSEKIDAVSELIENELILLGATAIEDKLQEGAPECIASLREAGIKVWVLTGDKLETAINIGFAAQLLTKEMRLWIVRGSNKESVMNQFNNVAGSLIGDQSVKRFTEDREEIPPITEGEVHAFVVDGAALAHLLDNDTVRQQLIQLSNVFHSVICCRVSPLQKAMVVELIRRGKRSTTLAIGDGANDVSMIQAANVGVGISGQEGVQAAMAADYSIAQFRFLRTLLLVHGHWDYLRISEMILNFFYKNVIWVFPVLWYQIYCFFVQLYNMLFTVAPVIILGATDQSVGQRYCLRYPSIYTLGIKQARYSKVLFGLYFLDGIWQSLVVYFTFNYIYSLSTNITSADGTPAGTIEFSTAVAVTVVVIANLFIGFNTYYWTCPILGIGQQLFSDVVFWFGMLFAIFVAGLPRYFVLFLKQWWYPDDLDIVRQIRKKEKTDKKKNEKRPESNDKQPVIN